MIAALVLAAIYLVLFVFALQRRTRRGPAESWLLVYCAFSVVLMGVHALMLSGQVVLPAPLDSRQITGTGFTISLGLMVLLTMATLSASWRVLAGTAAAAAAWALIPLAADLAGLQPLVGTPAWMLNLTGADLSAGGEIRLAGWLAIVLLLFILSWRAFLTQPLPLYANRTLFWAVVSPLVLFGDALATWPNQPWYMVGYGLRLLGTMGLVYGILAHRLLDLREAMRWIISHLALTLTGALLIVGGFSAAVLIQIPALGPYERWIITGVTALITAALLLPASRFVRWLMGRVFSRTPIDPAEAVRRYSQQISGIIDLDELADMAGQTFNDLLGTRRGYLILGTEQEDGVRLEQVSDGISQVPPTILASDSPLYQHFIEDKTPLLQYDIDYDKRFGAVAEEERGYFGGLEMDVYAPIVSDGHLIGLFALGPKANDDPFRPNEIELLAALSEQTVVALKNARLVNDLRDLNERISALNESLQATNERLKQLDAVKTDFISIASHELRTPLTQIQGYADLLLEMAERHLLEPADMADITRNLSKASQRMTDVISSMMDVSQIDIANMDLNFVETTLSSVIKLSVEPYSEAIRERKQTLVARGLRNLPPIQADFRRLVQAFQNLITNAIKFTPDGGKIEISGEIHEQDEQGQPASVRVTIKDSGIGIDQQHLDLVFQKFFRVGPVALHSTGQTKFKGGGTGLGLSITRGIIEGHSGRIWVESPGCNEETFPGSVFHVVLPVRPRALETRQMIEQVQQAKDETIIGAAAAPADEAVKPPSDGQPPPGEQPVGPSGAAIDPH